jgi:hypothetical protein
MRRALAMSALAVGLTVFGAGGAAALSGCGGVGGGCCKVCHVGKACGDTCISRDYACHVGAGCACNG